MAVTRDPADSVAELLGADHRHLDALLAEVRHRLAAKDPASAGEPFAAFREGLERHIEAEEQVLFPVFERHAGTGAGGPTAVMRAEHAQLRQSMADVASALERSAPDALTRSLGTLTALILAHNGKEERVLYPMTDEFARRAGGLDELVERLREVLDGTR